MRMCRNMVARLYVVYIHDHILLRVPNTCTGGVGGRDACATLVMCQAGNGTAASTPLGMSMTCIYSSHFTFHFFPPTQSVDVGNVVFMCVISWTACAQK